MPFVTKSQALTKGKLKKGCRRIKTPTGIRYMCEAKAGVGRAKKRKKSTSRKGKKCVTFGDGRTVCFRRKAKKRK